MFWSLKAFKLMMQILKGNLKIQSLLPSMRHYATSSIRA